MRDRAGVWSMIGKGGGWSAPRAFAACLLLSLGGCSVISSSPPANLDNACSIVGERPSWKRDMRKAEARWGVPMSVQMAIIWQESKFVQRARTDRRRTFFGLIPGKRRSSAYGYAQVIDGTWDWYKSATGKRSARRDDFGDAVDFIGWYSDRATSRLGIPKSDVRRQYIAYHEGHSGYARGSYRNKRWLLDVARKLESRERRYRSQLRTCA